MLDNDNPTQTTTASAPSSESPSSSAAAPVKTPRRRATKAAATIAPSAPTVDSPPQKSPAASDAVEPAPEPVKRARKAPAKRAAKVVPAADAEPQLTAEPAVAAQPALVTDVDLEADPSLAKAPARRRRTATRVQSAPATVDVQPAAAASPEVTAPSDAAADEIAPTATAGRRARTTEARRRRSQPEITDEASIPDADGAPASGPQTVDADSAAGAAVVDGPPARPARGRGRGSAAKTPAAAAAPALFLAPSSPPAAPLFASGAASATPFEPATADTDAESSRPPRQRRGRRPAGAEIPAIASEPVLEDGSDEALLAEPLLDDAGLPIEDESESASDDGGSQDEELDEFGARRRRRRGRRGRGGREVRPNSGGTAEADLESDQSVDDEIDGSQPSESEDDDSEEIVNADGTTRRRRKRRRRGGGPATGEDDPAQTVVHVRESREPREPREPRESRDSDDEVRGVRGSTRLEAKRQRRRDNRETGRRRVPILTEAEFLARRESVERVMAMRQRGDRTQIAVLEDGILVEHYVTRASATTYAGNIYLGRVQNVLPSMEAAFVDIGKGRNGVLYAGEVNWDAAGLDGKSRAIENAMGSGDVVLVQVTKDPIGHKGARLTSQISLPGRFLVYVPGGGMTGISRKLPDTERTRLKAILKKIVPDEVGVIIRTAAEGATEEELTQDVERLTAQWEAIKKASEKTASAPIQVHGEPDLAIRVVRDVFNEDFVSLVVEGDDAYSTVSDYVGSVAPDLAVRISKYVGTGDLFSDLRVDEQLAKALDRKVYLPSGGSLVIDRTEAMTVVDVNTGKFVGAGGNLEQTVTRNNLEAAEEIVRQLRLRDIGGIVVIDFIDMVLESNRDLVLRRLTECLGRDRTKHQVAEITSLGLVQMTRKRVGEGLLEAFSEPCEHCQGRGVIVHTEPVTKRTGSAPAEFADGGDSRGPRRARGRRDRDLPAEVLPVVPEEQRRAAASAIAAIAKTLSHDTSAHDGPHDSSSSSAPTTADDITDVSYATAVLDADEVTPYVPVDADAVLAGDGLVESVEMAEATFDAADAMFDSESLFDNESAVEFDNPANGSVEVETSIQANGYAPTIPAPAGSVAAAPSGRRRRGASRPAGPPVHAVTD
jgi:ribonuclease E